MENIDKKCTKCEEEKPYSDFSKDKRNKDGMGAVCLKCFAKRARELSPKRKVKKAEEGKLYREANKEKIKARLHKYYLDHKEIYKQRAERWRTEKPDMAKEMYKRRDQKLSLTPKGRIGSIISSAINNSLHRGSKANRHWESLVGFTVDQLKTHLEKGFKPGMSWKNYGSHWHIDHKIPKAAFNFEKPEDIDFRRCWDLKNLQPLEAIKNMSKGGRVDKPFQPSLTI